MKSLCAILLLLLCLQAQGSGWSPPISGGGGGWSGDSLDLRVLAVSDSAFIDTLEVHVVNGASPITFLDPIVVDSINPSGGTTTFGGALAASALAVDAFSIDSADVKVRALSTLDFRSYEGFGEIRFGPDSVAWITEEIEALKTHYVLDMGTDASGNIYILTQKSDYALNLWVRDHITGAWSYSSIEAMVGWASSGNMAVSPSGDVFVTWCRDAGTADIKFRARIAGAWQATQIIGSGYNFLSVGVDIENGILGLTYRNESGMIIYNESLNSGASWSADTVVASGAYGSDLAIVDGVPHVVYSSASSTLFESVRIAPSTWSAGNTISPNYVSLPRVESCGDTLATVSARGSNFVYGYRVGDGDWVVEKVGASSQFAIGARFSLSLDSVGSAHLIYLGDDYNIYYWTNASGSWVGTTFNTSGNCTYPALCVDGDVVRASYCAVNQNFSMFSDTLGSGLNTGYSGITMRMNSAVSGAASSIMIDAGGYLNDSSQSGTIYLGDKNGRDSVVAYGPWFCRTVNDAGPMTATNGTEGEIVYNLANDKFYGCTATGTPATWSAFN